MTFKLDLPSRRISAISPVAKAKALARIYVEGESIKAVLREVYAAYGKDIVPKRPHQALHQWRKAVQRALDEGDEEVVAVCERMGILLAVEERVVGRRFERHSD